MTYAKSIFEDGLLYKGFVIVGGWEGAANIPGGKKYFPPFVEDVTILVDGHDITEMIKDEAITEIEQKLIERVLEDLEDEGPKRYRDDA